MLLVPWRKWAWEVIEKWRHYQEQIRNINRITELETKISSIKTHFCALFIQPWNYFVLRVLQSENAPKNDNRCKVLKDDI